MFTLNNPEEVQLPKRWADAVRYCVWQLEEGEQGTRHLQGYAVFRTPRQMAGLKRLCANAHWELRRGSHDQAKAYCKKEETRLEGPFEYGDEPKGQGARTDLSAVRRDLDAGMSLVEISDKHFGTFLRYNRALRDYQTIHSPQQRNWPTKTRVFIGPTGTGKSRRALVEAGPEAFWLRKPNGNNVWWDGYNGERHVVIDEFYGWLPYDFLLRLLDRYPLMVDIKGGCVPMLARRIWITTNTRPEWWYKKIDNIQPLQRRLRPPCGEMIEMAEGVWAPSEGATQCADCGGVGEHSVLCDRRIAAVQQQIVDDPDEEVSSSDSGETLRTEELSGELSEYERSVRARTGRRTTKGLEGLR